MNLKNALFLLSIALVLALSGCGGGGVSLDASRTTSNQTLAASTAPTIKMALFGGTPNFSAETQQRYGLFVGGEHKAKEMAEFKAANPEAKNFLYQIAAAAAEVEYARTTPTDPIGYYWIDENHPEWFLLDSEGKRIAYKDYPEIWALDPGNKAYQDMWAEKAIERAKRIGADGVKIDAANSRYDWHHTTVPTKYPTQQDYYLAMDAFVRNVIPKIQAAGLLVIGNGSGEPWNTGAWSEWIDIFDGREQEALSGYLYEPLWRDFLNSYTRLPNKLYVYYLPNPQLQPELFRYNVASYLLFMGPSSYASCPHTDSPEPIYDPLLDIRIGQPTGPCVQLGENTYRRTFEFGEVLLNISSSKAEAVEVGSGLSDVLTGPVAAGPVTLAPHQSLILISQ